MSRPLCIDLFAGGGGAALGLIAAGFDVLGVDVKPSPRYPGPCMEGDALSPPVDLSTADLVWASPPCQRFTLTSRLRAPDHHLTYPDLCGPVRKMLDEAGRPYIIENVPAAPIRHDVVLTGPCVGLYRIKRARAFELSWWADGHFALTPEPYGPTSRDFARCVAVTITTSLSIPTMYYRRKRMGLSGRLPIAEARAAMGISTPMTAHEVGNAVAPPMAAYLGRLAKEQLQLGARTK